ncbi:hypothetical protein HYFRA_00001911 [Hymenoscyphus fraxineus]|uniref:Uncharacterized protein n=1 Tax=Hymenoscyphus fraxineus TaxID=746836 RepID=A0A9N9KKA7_9HELO|nr:hypothetical protein HYFRA_00001911 [Hymenoscyphus fraxineus]
MSLFKGPGFSRSGGGQKPHYGRTGGGGQTPHYGRSGGGQGSQGGQYNPQQPRPYSRGMRGGQGPMGQGNYNQPPPPPPPLNASTGAPNLGGTANQQPSPIIQHMQQQQYPPPLPNHNPRQRNIPYHAQMGNRFPTPGAGGSPLGGGVGGSVGGVGGIGVVSGMGGGYGSGNAMGAIGGGRRGGGGPDPRRYWAPNSNAGNFNHLFQKPRNVGGRTGRI